MKEIKIQTGIEVKVNNAGDTITLHVDDQLFIERFYKLIETISSAREKVKECISKNTDKKEIMEYTTEQMLSVKEEIDKVFGENCCKKVFGDIVPSPRVVSEFFEQLVPIINDYNGMKYEKVNARYNRNRKNRKNKNKTMRQPNA